MIVRCIRYKPVNQGNFSGFADITLPELGIEIYGCTLYQKNAQRWVNLPVRSYKDSSGEEKFSPIVRFSDQEKFHEFCADAKSAVDKYAEEVNSVKE